MHMWCLVRLEKGQMTGSIVSIQFICLWVVGTTNICCFSLDPIKYTDNTEICLTDNNPQKSI